MKDIARWEQIRPAASGSLTSAITARPLSMPARKTERALPILRTRSMLLAVFAIAALLASRGSKLDADTTWKDFPGWHVHALAFSLADSHYRFVQGRDGYVYRTGLGLSRVTDTDGQSELVQRCPTDVGTDDAKPVPTFWCFGKNTLSFSRNGASLMTRQLALPPLGPQSDIYRYDWQLLSGVSAIPNNAWMFVFGDAHRIGIVASDGSMRYRDTVGSPRIWHVAQASGTVYGAVEGCTLASIADLAIIHAWKVPSCVPDDRGAGFTLLARHHHIWALSDHELSTVDRGGFKAWAMDINPIDVDVARDGTIYVLGNSTAPKFPMFLVRIARDGVMRSAHVPLSGPTSMSLDARGRVWIAQPDIRSATILTPP